MINVPKVVINVRDVRENVRENILFAHRQYNKNFKSK